MCNISTRQAVDDADWPGFFPYYPANRLIAKTAITMILVAAAGRGVVGACSNVDSQLAQTT